MPQTEAERLTGAYELGCSRGWDHANYVDAYGKIHERKGPDYPGHVLPIKYGSAEHWRLSQDDRITEQVIRPRLTAEFRRGWTDGRKRFHQGRYANGEKIVD